MQAPPFNPLGGPQPAIGNWPAQPGYKPGMNPPGQAYLAQQASSVFQFMPVPKPGTQQVGGYAPFQTPGYPPQMQQFNISMQGAQFQKSGAAYPGFNPQVQGPPLPVQQLGSSPPSNPQMHEEHPQFHQKRQAPKTAAGTVRKAHQLCPIHPGLLQPLRRRKLI